MLRAAAPLIVLTPALVFGQGSPSKAELERENASLKKLNAQLNKQFAKLRKAKQKVINDLRRQLTRAEDQALDLARRFDTDRKRSQDAKAKLLEELARLKRAHALEVARLEAELARLKAQVKNQKDPAQGPAKPAADPLARQVTLNFPGTPLSEVLGFLTDITGLRHRLAPADAALGSTVKVSLRLEGIGLRNALDLIAASHGKLGWRLEGRQVVFSTQPALVTSPSGLGVMDRVIGDGAEAARGKTVTLHYVGTLNGGTVFDSSRARKTPFRFVLGKGQVIDGWEEGILGMKVGGKRKLVIPPNLAYGRRAVGKIPPNSTLTFEVELLKVE